MASNRTNTSDKLGRSVYRPYLRHDESSSDVSDFADNEEIATIENHADKTNETIQQQFENSSDSALSSDEDLSSTVQGKDNSGSYIIQTFLIGTCAIIGLIFFRKDIYRFMNKNINHSEISFWLLYSMKTLFRVTNRVSYTNIFLGLYGRSE